MLFGLSIFLLSAVLAAAPLALRSQRQWQYRAGLGQDHRRADCGAVLIAACWCLLLGTFLLGATSPEPLAGWLPVSASCGWLAGVASGIAGLRLRPDDPERANLASVVFLWGGFAIDPYVRDILPTVPTLIVGGAIVTAVLAVRLIRWRRRTTSA